MEAPWPMTYSGRPPAQKSQAWACRLPALWLFALLLGYLALIMPTALDQKGGPTASPTPSATLEVEVEEITPEEAGRRHLGHVGEEFQQDQHLLGFLVERDWQRLLSNGSAGGSNDTAPSMRSGVV